MPYRGPITRLWSLLAAGTCLVVAYVLSAAPQARAASGRAPLHNSRSVIEGVFPAGASKNDTPPVGPAPQLRCCRVVLAKP